jgi:hypothetical protein
MFREFVNQGKVLSNGSLESSEARSVMTKRKHREPSQG